MEFVLIAGSNDKILEFAVFIMGFISSSSPIVAIRLVRFHFIIEDRFAIEFQNSNLDPYSCLNPDVAIILSACKPNVQECLVPFNFRYLSTNFSLSS